MVGSQHLFPQIDIRDSDRVIWAVPSIHGDLNRLVRLHDHIFEKFQVGDQLVYLGNYTGYGDQSAACIDELLTFRRLLLSLPGMRCDDIIYLRGAQEEMWHKLLLLPFAPHPSDTLIWMLGNGVKQTLESYGFDAHESLFACRSGSVGLTQWANALRKAIRLHAGHEAFNLHLQRACHTNTTHDVPILFVNAGLDPSQPLDKQTDQFWWHSNNFETIQSPYLPFKKIVRGYDPQHKGIHNNDFAFTLDDGCGFGGNLVSAAFKQSGEICEFIEA